MNVLLDTPGVTYEDSAIPGVRWRLYTGRRPLWETRGETTLLSRLVYAAAALLTIASAAVAWWQPWSR